MFDHQSTGEKVFIIGGDKAGEWATISGIHKEGPAPADWIFHLNFDGRTDHLQGQSEPFQHLLSEFITNAIVRELKDLWNQIGPDIFEAMNYPRAQDQMPEPGDWVDETLMGSEVQEIVADRTNPNTWTSHIAKVAWRSMDQTARKAVLELAFPSEVEYV